MDLELNNLESSELKQNDGNILKYVIVAILVIIVIGIMAVFVFSLNLIDEFGWKSYPADLSNTLSPEEFSKLPDDHKKYYHGNMVDNELQYEKTTEAKYDTGVYWRWAVLMISGCISCLSLGYPIYIMWDRYKTTNKNEQKI